MKEYKLKYRHGIDDLKGIWAFTGNSQGYTNSGHNNIEWFKASEGWESFRFDCEMSDEAIAEEIKKRVKYNEDYINQLHKEGRYGTEYEISVKMEENDLFDAPIKDKPLMSYTATFLDLSS